MNEFFYTNKVPFGYFTSCHILRYQRRSILLTSLNTLARWRRIKASNLSIKLSMYSSIVYISIYDI